MQYEFPTCDFRHDISKVQCITNETVIVLFRVEQSEFMEFSEVSVFVNKEVNI